MGGKGATSALSLFLITNTRQQLDTIMNHMGWWPGSGMLTWTVVSLVILVLIVVVAVRSRSR
jgi:hypothetical protein